MAKAIARARTHFDTVPAARELARIAFVAGCALALIAAGPFLPY